MPLIRQPLPPLLPLDMDEELASKAQSILNYTINVHKLEKTQKSRQVYDWMVNNHVHPFTPESVKDYKYKKLLNPHFKYDLLAITIILTGIIFLIYNLNKFGYMHNIWAYILYGVSSLTVVVSAAMSYERNFKWETTNFSGSHWYHREVPEHVLRTLVTIKETFPSYEAQFDVCECISADTTASKRNYEDAFLVLRLPDSSEYYLELWNQK